MFAAGVLVLLLVVLASVPLLLLVVPGVVVEASVVLLVVPDVLLVAPDVLLVFASVLLVVPDVPVLSAFSLALVEAFGSSWVVVDELVADESELDFIDAAGSSYQKTLQ